MGEKMSSIVNKKKTLYKSNFPPIDLIFIFFLLFSLSLQPVDYVYLQYKIVTHCSPWCPDKKKSILSLFNQFAIVPVQFCCT